jgi:hypothetical protein
MMFERSARAQFLGESREVKRPALPLLEGSISDEARSRGTRLGGRRSADGKPTGDEVGIAASVCRVC